MKLQEHTLKIGGWNVVVNGYYTPRYPEVRYDSDGTGTSEEPESFNIEDVLLNGEIDIFSLLYELGCNDVIQRIEELVLEKIEKDDWDATIDDGMDELDKW